MSKLVTIATFYAPHEAHIAQGVLEENNIESTIQGEVASQMYGQAAEGIVLQVREDDFENAKKIIDNLSFETSFEKD